MLLKINTFYNSIINIGVNNTLDNGVLKKIRLLNIYALIWFHLIFIYLISDYLSGIFQLRIAYSHVVGAMVMLSVFKLHKHQKHNQAKTIWMAYAIIHFFLLSSIFNKGWFLEYYFLLIPCFALSLYDNINVGRALLVLSFILFLVPTFIINIYPDLYKEQIQVISLLGIFVTLFMLVLYYKKLNRASEHLLAVERDKVLSDKMILEEQDIELRELNQFKSHFFVNLSHEIRTPLTLIQGYANQFNFKNSDKENQQKAAIIKEQCLQMQDILNSIMDLSKMESNQFQLVSTAVDLNAFLEKHVVNFQSLFAKKNISLSFNNHTLNRSIIIDESLFSKAITNLLSNALKFTPVNGRVSVNTFATSEGLKIDITDTGIGIQENHSKSIFKRFYQIKNDITKSQGSGIGLAFTKSIVEAHNFSIDVKSTFGKGACFSIYIPKKYIKLDETTLPINTIEIIKTSYKKPKTKPLTHRKPNILIVDDHEQMRVYLKKVLKNYSITEAAHGEEALTILQKNNFDLIVTDYMMPVMDGAALVKQLKQQQNKTPIIVLTARTDQQGKLSMLRLGIDGYLHKPFIEEELLINVKNSIALYKNVLSFDKKNSTEELKIINEYSDKFNTKITSYINKNINSPLLTVDGIAQHMAVSRSTLSRKVKSILGQTVNQLIQEARLEKARQLRLDDPFASKKQIAEAVGFSNTTYLFDKLHERYGI